MTVYQVCYVAPGFQQLQPCINSLTGGLCFVPFAPSLQAPEPAAGASAFGPVVQQQIVPLVNQVAQPYFIPQAMQGVYAPMVASAQVPALLPLRVGASAFLPPGPVFAYRWVKTVLGWIIDQKTDAGKAAVQRLKNEIGLFSHEPLKNDANQIIPTWNALGSPPLWEESLDSLWREQALAAQFIYKVRENTPALVRKWEGNFVWEE